MQLDTDHCAVVTVVLQLFRRVERCLSGHDPIIRSCSMGGNTWTDKQYTNTIQTTFFNNPSEETSDHNNFNTKTLKPVASPWTFEWWVGGGGGGE